MSGKPASLSRRSKSAAKAALTRESSVLNGAGCGTGASVAAVKPLTNLARARDCTSKPDRGVRSRRPHRRAQRIGWLRIWVGGGLRGMDSAI